MYKTDQNNHNNDMYVSQVNIEPEPGNPIDKSHIAFKCFILMSHGAQLAT